jgi:hypothetical protein
MNDPERLLQSGATGLERLMLNAARRDGPSAELHMRMAGGLGFGASGVPVARATADAGSASIVTTVAAAGAVATTASLVGKGFSKTAGLSTTTVMLSAGMLVLAVAGAFGLRTLSSSSRDDAGNRPLAAAAAPVPVASAAQVGDSQVGDRNDLRDEIRLLDDVRASLQAHASRRALTALDRYVGRHPRGTFEPEASVLRIEALRQDGQNRAAAALSAQFVVAHPDSPLLERVRRGAGSVSQ